MSKLSLIDSACRIKQAQQVLSLWLEAPIKKDKLRILGRGSSQHSGSLCGMMFEITTKDANHWW